jgi:hypothetical protein
MRALSIHPPLPARDRRAGGADSPFRPPATRVAGALRRRLGLWKGFQQTAIARFPPTGFAVQDRSGGVLNRALEGGPSTPGLRRGPAVRPTPESSCNQGRIALNAAHVSPVPRKGGPTHCGPMPGLPCDANCPHPIGRCATDGMQGLAAHLEVSRDQEGQYKRRGSSRSTASAIEARPRRRAPLGLPRAPHRRPPGRSGRAGEVPGVAVLPGGGVVAKGSAGGGSQAPGA